MNSMAIVMVKVQVNWAVGVIRELPVITCELLVSTIDLRILLTSTNLLFPTPTCRTQMSVHQNVLTLDLYSRTRVSWEHIW